MDDTVESCLVKIYNTVPEGIDLSDISSTLEQNSYYAILQRNNPEMTTEELRKRLFVYSVFMILWAGYNFNINDLRSKIDTYL